MDYTWEQVKESIAHVSVLFEEIRVGYAPLKPYMVFASPYGQLPLDAGPLGVLRCFPWMAAENAAKARAVLMENMVLSWIAKGRKVDSDKSRRAETEILTQVEKLTFRGDVNFELRFGQLDYPLIWQLQEDPLIDRELTPQTKASIRIVVTNLDRAWQRMQAERQKAGYAFARSEGQEPGRPA